MSKHIAGQVHDYIISRTPIVTLDSEVNIFESGFVNSLFAIELMTFLEQRFSIKITMHDLDMINFSSIQRITQFVEQKLQRGLQ